MYQVMCFWVESKASMKKFLSVFALLLAMTFLGCGGGGGGGGTSGGAISPSATPTPVTVAMVSVFAPGVTFNLPKHLLFSGGNLYVANQPDILKVSSAGALLQSYAVTNPIGIGTQSNNIYHTGELGGFDGIFQLGNPTFLVDRLASNNFDGIAFYSTNMLFVANVTYVLAYTNFSNPQRISLTSTPISLASDIAKARVYLSTDDGKIGYINPTNPSAGVTNLTQTSPARWGPLQRPNGMVVASTGFVYVVSQGDLSGNGGYISKIDTTTGIAEVLVSDSVGSWGSLPVGFCGPTGITIDSTNENLFVSNGSCSASYSGYGNRNKILKIKLP
jgi:hypothetical protein